MQKTNFMNVLLVEFCMRQLKRLVLSWGMMALEYDGVSEGGKKLWFSPVRHRLNGTPV